MKGQRVEAALALTLAALLVGATLAALLVVLAPELRTLWYVVRYFFLQGD